MTPKNTAVLSKILSGCDVPRGTLGKLTAIHATHVLPALRKDPYGILQSVGVSLEVADRVAVTLKTSLEQRTLGYATWILTTRSMNVAMLSAKLQFAFEMPLTKIRGIIDKLVTTGVLAHVETQIMSTTLYQQHIVVVSDVRRRVRSGNLQNLKLHIPDEKLRSLTTEQRVAVKMAITRKVSVITGGPGAGKSHVVRKLMEHIPNARVTAPTGRAARNASGKTVHYFKTIQESGKNDFHGVDLIVIDEASMLSLNLFATVVEMAPREAHIVLVGDVDQLPPIECGDVLRDLIESGIVPVTRLTLNLRSSTDIQQFACGMLQGAVDIPTNSKDITIIECDTFDDVINGLPGMGFHVGDAMGNSWAYSFPMDRYAILTPHNATRIAINKAVQLSVWGAIDDELDITLTKDFPGAPRGTRGVATIKGSSVKVMADHGIDFNVSLAAADKLIAMDNRSGGISGEAGCVVLPGDKVIITKNTTTACNGDMGTYTSVATSSVQRVIIGKDMHDIPKVSDTDPGLTLAYAITVHKAQGSEFEAVILPITNVSAWDRALLYTAVTRAKTAVYFMGCLEDVKAIVRTVRPPRTSLLKTLLSN
jgi:exodeoxyribonuclease V alpha subunit